MDTPARIQALAAQCGLSATDPLGLVIAEVSLIPNEVRTLLADHATKIEAVAERIEQLGDPRVTQSVVSKLVHAQVWKESLAMTGIMLAAILIVAGLVLWMQPTFKCGPDADGHTICWYRKD